jgi:excisionase family DNA binding protein
MKKLPEPESGRPTAGEIMTLPQVAEYLHCYPSTLYRLLKRRQIPGFLLGGDWRFRRADVEEWIAQQSAIPESDAATAPELRIVRARVKGKPVRKPRSKE